MTVVIAPGAIASVRQREAIEALLGPVLVLAGPGAGKTFCLIERIRFLIEQKGDKPRARKELEEALKNKPSRVEETQIRNLLNTI